MTDNSLKLIGECESRIDAENISGLKTFLKKNDFPMDEEYYLWIDNSLLNTGRGNGAAVGAHGLALKDKDAIYLLWTDIDGFRRQGKMIYVDNKKKPGNSCRIDTKTNEEEFHNGLLDTLKDCRQLSVNK